MSTCTCRRDGLAPCAWCDGSLDSPRVLHVREGGDWSELPDAVCRADAPEALTSYLGLLLRALAEGEGRGLRHERACRRCLEIMEERGVAKMSPQGREAWLQARAEVRASERRSG